MGGLVAGCGWVLEVATSRRAYGDLNWMVVQTGQVFLEAVESSFIAKLYGAEFLICGVYHFYRYAYRTDEVGVFFQIHLVEASQALAG